MNKIIRTLYTAAILAALSVSTQAFQPEIDIPVNVPDGGSSVGLLALGIGAVALMRRNRK